MKKSNQRIRWWRVALWTLGGLAIGLVFRSVGLAILIGLVFGFARIVGELSRPRIAQPDATPPLKPEMAAHYQASGLDEQEVTLFRETMDTAADQIQEFEAVINRVPKLKAIAQNHDLVAVLHAYFKAIVRSPKQMSAAGHFIYEQLPNLARISAKYEAIAQHEVKTEDTYAVLTTAANTTADLAEAIRQDYANFVEADIDALEADINLAQKQIPKATQTIDRRVNLSGVKDEIAQHNHQ